MKMIPVVYSSQNSSWKLCGVYLDAAKFTVLDMKYEITP